MSNLGLNQDWITKATEADAPDVSVIGADQSDPPFDVVKELRTAATQIAAANLYGWGNICSDAADEIERLRRSIAHLHDELDRVTGALVDINDCRYECSPAVANEVERLRNLL